MQDAPDKATLLGALAKFLVEDVQPAIADRGLGFRVRIAAHLADTLRREVQLEEQHDAAELERLRALLDERRDPPKTPAARREAIQKLNKRLAKALRDDLVDADAARAALMETLREKLAVVQPRFDTTIDLPEREAP